LDGERGVGFWLADFWRACRGRKGDVLTCLIFVRWIRWWDPALLFITFFLYRFSRAEKVKTSSSYLPTASESTAYTELIYIVKIKKYNINRNYLIVLKRLTLRASLVTLFF
jgi:hypothetical protein